MKKTKFMSFGKIKYIIVILAIIFALFYGIVLFNNNVNSIAIAESKDEININQDDEFYEDSVLVVLDSKISGKNKKHEKSFFAGVEIESIKDLTICEENRVLKKDFQQILQLFLKFPSKENVIKAVNILNKIDGIVSAEPNYILSAAASPNDNLYVSGKQWNVNNTQGTDAESAWNLTTGSSDIRVGIIDSGIASQADLNPNVIEGYDFYNNNNITNDDQHEDMHGTKVAAVLGAVGNNEIGIAGIN